MKKIVTITVDETLFNWIESKRGTIKRSPYIEALIRRGVYDEERGYQ
jgi:hypothetical protein